MPSAAGDESHQPATWQRDDGGGMHVPIRFQHYNKQHNTHLYNKALSQLLVCHVGQCSSDDSGNAGAHPAALIPVHITCGTLVILFIAVHQHGKRRCSVAACHFKHVAVASLSGQDAACIIGSGLCKLALLQERAQGTNNTRLLQVVAVDSVCRQGCQGSEGYGQGQIRGVWMQSLHHRCQGGGGWNE